MVNLNLKVKALFILMILAKISLYGQDTPATSDALKNTNKMLPVLFQQHAAEYRALCYQAFNLASLKLESLKRKRRGLPYAIITDIDETILDNSKYEAQRIKDGKEFTFASWKRWTDQSSATLVPGAGEFLKKARDKGISIFYISNRDTSEIKSTIINLQNLDVPYADTEHLLFHVDQSSKETRRQQIGQRYNVIMLIGDNLNDFTQIFEKKNIKERKNEVEKIKGEWGNRFIVLPNSIYGEWENALYDYKSRLTDQKRDSILRATLVGVENGD
jgi:5'-nucleotidase (lipoprotein e(P4) family)